MRIHAILAAALVLQGCAYTTESTQKMTTPELCITLHDRGSISGVPERNAAAELAARGNPDCGPIMQQYREGIRAWAAQPEPQKPSGPVICSGSVIGKQTTAVCR